MIDRRRTSLLRDEAGPAEHAVSGERRLELRCLPRPVEQIHARDVHERIRNLVLPRMSEDVMQVILAVDAKCGVWIAGPAVASGMHQVKVE